MLKELNSIAVGLLGLEGFPLKSLWSNGAQRRERDADPDPLARASVGSAAANDGRSPGHHAVNCC